MSKTLKIAILSDLHCQGMAEKDKRRESFLAVGDPRVPGNRHPVQALIDIIAPNNLSADVIIGAGDFTHKTALDGFSLAWSLLNELKSKLHSKYCFSTLGNHDTSSRSSGGDPFKIARTIHPEFPFTKTSDSDCFWANGYCLQSIPGCADFLMINTSYDHYSAELAKRGSFSSEQIESLDHYLKSLDNNIRIAVMHHNPVVHSFSHFHSTEVLPTGDQLIKLLANHGFQVIIHGHRHEPRISRFSSDGNELHIFSAGSFSVFLAELSSRTRNLFHILELTHNKTPTEHITGKIKSWEYNYGSGWNPSSPKSAEIPHEVNIGPAAPFTLVNDIIRHFTSKSSTHYLNYKELASQFPSIKNMLPEEILKLNSQLSKKAAIRIKIDELGKIKGIGKIHQI